MVSLGISHAKGLRKASIVHADVSIVDRGVDVENGVYVVGGQTLLGGTVEEDFLLVQQQR